MLDTIAAMVSGSDLAGGRAAISFVRASGAKPVADDGRWVLCRAIGAALAMRQSG